MTKKADLRSILVLGSGPIVIGQACEFDYSGTQAVRALAAEGYRVILANSNPATIMTDPDLLLASKGELHGAGNAHATYMEPLNLAALAKIIDRERPDAILPTVGGQTAINLTLEAAKAGLFEKFGVRLLGANIDALELAEDRQRFKTAMLEIGLDVPRSKIVSSVDEATEAAEDLGFPLVVRASFTLAGMGSGVAHTGAELHSIVTRGLELSPVHEVLIEESVHGWREFELEVMRDCNDQAVVVCSIENFDPMGVHTGDSVTIAPAMTLTDREYQTMRDQAFTVIRRVGVETGGSNIQFAVHPTTRRMVVIEMNPRVSRSSALASKATGFPIAKIAARLAVGYTLDQITNDITEKTPAMFEPVLDYVVVKIPRWNFEKFPGASSELGTQMKSVGEVMAIGRTFTEALQKGMRSLEMSTSQGADRAREVANQLTTVELLREIIQPRPERIYFLREWLMRRLQDSDREGASAIVRELAETTGIDPWFLRQLASIVELERWGATKQPRMLSQGQWMRLKQSGLSDRRLGRLWGIDAATVSEMRKQEGVVPVFHRIDTCAGEFASETPYLYSTYESRSEARPTDRRKVLILGGGPIRIGQGIEFDYCACHAAFALRETDVESILVNCNPETVSTDYDTADRLYFEPVTFEDVMNVVDTEQPEGVIVQFGGQTPLNLAHSLEAAGLKILGTSVEAIDLAEDRERFSDLLASLEIPTTEMGLARSSDEAVREAERIGYPVIVRPSYVLGGRAMMVVYTSEELAGYADEALALSGDNALFLDRFLEDAFEVDVDAVCDGDQVFVAAIQQHIEEAGVHSGDSACVLPPYKISDEDQKTLSVYTQRIAQSLGVCGLLNVQFAIKNGVIYVIEANPRASRTIPYVSKAIGVPLVNVATRILLGEKLASLVPPALLDPASLPYRRCLAGRIYVKMPVFSSNRFPDVDTLLGPEMRSTGEVLGIGKTFGQAYVKAALGVGMNIPLSGSAFVSVHDKDKVEALPIVQDLVALGFRIVATSGTAQFLSENGVKSDVVFKVNEGHPNVADRIAAAEIQLIINTPLGRESHFDESAIRKAALAHGVPCITTLSGSRAIVDGIRTFQADEWSVESIQSIDSEREVLTT